MKTTLFLFGLFSWMMLSHAEVTPFEVMVVADRVNLRNEASLESDVVGQVNYGDILTGLELTDTWVRVRPPSDLGVWVHGGLLFEEREVRARVLNVRSGPGTQFVVLGQLERMDEVKVLEAYDEWRRIEPTDAVQVWIFRELVQIPEPPAADEEEPAGEVAAEEGHETALEEVVVEDAAPEAAVEETVTGAVEEDEDSGGVAVVEEDVEEAVDVAAVPDVEEAGLPLAEIETVAEVVPVVVEAPTDAVVEAPEDVNLVPLEGQGTASVRRGWVKAYLIAGTAPSRFQLVYRERGREEALAYLRGDEAELRALAGRQVLVRGRDFWVAGQRLPLMRIESLEAEPEPRQ